MGEKNKLVFWIATPTSRLAMTGRDAHLRVMIYTLLRDDMQLLRVDDIQLLRN